jgi:hypothetical protein
MDPTSNQSNRETAERAYEAFGRSDIDEVTGIMDEQIEWIEAEGGPMGGVYHGPDEVVEEVFAPYAEEWTEFGVDPERFVEQDELVVALGTYSGTYAETRERIEVPFAHLWEFEDGRVVRWQQFTDTALFTEATAE